MRSDITPGGVFPDYTLPDHTGTDRRLSELQGRDPPILTLARGHYCPKQHQQHLELAAFQSKVAVAYTQIATITTDERHTLQEFRASVGAQWTFLSDPGRIVQKDLDIQEYTDPDNDPMIPHTLVLKPGLVIHTVYDGYWFWGRPSVYDLWRNLRAASSLLVGTRGDPGAPAVGPCSPHRPVGLQDKAATGMEASMDQAQARAMIQAHFDPSNVGVAGGGPEDEIVQASEIYARRCCRRLAAGR
jgi:peroxiredoxin